MEVSWTSKGRGLCAPAAAAMKRKTAPAEMVLIAAENTPLIAMGEFPLRRSRHFR
jgi:hypothetical protein